MDMTDHSAKDNDLGREAESSHRLNREMARIGRALFGYPLGNWTWGYRYRHLLFAQPWLKSLLS